MLHSLFLGGAFEMRASAHEHLLCHQTRFAKHSKLSSQVEACKANVSVVVMMISGICEHPASTILETAKVGASKSGTKKLAFLCSSLLSWITVRSSSELWQLYTTASSQQNQAFG